MNKLLKAALGIGAVGAAAVGAAAFLTAPAKATDEQKRPFMGRNFAHRGLYREDQEIPENSLSAFDLAASEGYGIELDVHITADDRLVVFHDDTLERMTDGEGLVEEQLWRELRELCLADSKERMPLFSEVLNVIDGRVPIILELKPDHRRYELCERVLEFIRTYKGEICIESFDPFIVGWFRKQAPDILRGQLSQPPKDFDGDLSPIKAFFLGNVLTNFIARPHFLAYKIGKKPFGAKLCQLMGAIRVGWTAHEPSAEERSDAVIFEYYRPSQRFK